MPDYAALRARWAELPPSTTPSQGIATINGLTETSSLLQDVPAAAVAGVWFGTGAYAKVFALSQQPLTGGSGDQAILAARMFVSEVDSGGTFGMSQSSIASQVQASMTVLESAGVLTATDLSNAMALAATTEPWWQANGYTSSFNGHDLVAAGILTQEQAIAAGVA